MFGVIIIRLIFVSFTSLQQALKPTQSKMDNRGLLPSEKQYESIPDLEPERPSCSTQADVRKAVNTSNRNVDGESGDTRPASFNYELNHDYAWVPIAAAFSDQQCLDNSSNDSEESGFTQEDLRQLPLTSQSLRPTHNYENVPVATAKQLQGNEYANESCVREYVNCSVKSEIDCDESGYMVPHGSLSPNPHFQQPNQR